MIRLNRWIILGLLLFVSGCYLPSDFEADLRISKVGNYIFNYKGRLTHLGLLRDLAQNEIGQDAALEKVAQIQRDLARDPGFGPGDTLDQRVANVKHLQNATFEVNYARKGSIVEEKSFTFVRFNSRMLGISRVPNEAAGGKGWVVKVFGDRPSKDLIEKLEEAGMIANGRFRIQTDAKVIKHNADSQYVAGGYPIYVWNIKSLKREAPHLSFELQGP